MDIDTELTVIAALRALAHDLGMAGGIERADELLDEKLANQGQ